MLAAAEEREVLRRRMPRRFYRGEEPGSQAASASSDAKETAAASPSVAEMPAWRQKNGDARPHLPFSRTDFSAQPSPLPRSSLPPPLPRSDGPPPSGRSLSSAESDLTLDGGHDGLLQESFVAEGRQESYLSQKLPIYQQQDRLGEGRAVFAGHTAGAYAQSHDGRGNPVRITESNSTPPGTGFRVTGALQDPTLKEGRVGAFLATDDLRDALPRVQVGKNEAEDLSSSFKRQWHSAPLGVSPDGCRSNLRGDRPLHSRYSTSPGDGRMPNRPAEHASSGTDSDSRHQGLDAQTAYRARESWRHEYPQVYTAHDRLVDGGYTTHSSLYTGGLRQDYNGPPMGGNIDRFNTREERPNREHDEELPTSGSYNNSFSAQDGGDYFRHPDRRAFDTNYDPEEYQHAGRHNVTECRSAQLSSPQEERTNSLHSCGRPACSGGQVNENFPRRLWSAVSGVEGNPPDGRLNTKQTHPSYGETAREKLYSGDPRLRGMGIVRSTPADVREGYDPRLVRKEDILATRSWVLETSDSLTAVRKDLGARPGGLVGVVPEPGRHRPSWAGHTPAYHHRELRYPSSRPEDPDDTPHPRTSQTSSNSVTDRKFGYPMPVSANVAEPELEFPSTPHSAHSFRAAVGRPGVPSLGQSGSDLEYRGSSTTMVSSSYSSSLQVSFRPAAFASSGIVPPRPPPPLGWVRPINGRPVERSDSPLRALLPTEPATHRHMPYTLSAASSTASPVYAGPPRPDVQSQQAAFAPAATTAYPDTHKGLPASDLPQGAFASRPSLYRRPGAAYTGRAVDPARLKSGGLGGLLKKKKADPDLKSAIDALNHPH